jgi:hypothetical protein
MGTTPAVVLARIKVHHPAWTIPKTADQSPLYVAQQAAVPPCAHGNVARPSPARTGKSMFIRCRDGYSQQTREWPRMA